MTTQTKTQFNYRGVILRAVEASGTVKQSDILRQYPHMDATDLHTAAAQLRHEGEILIDELLPPIGIVYHKMEQPRI